MYLAVTQNPTQEQYYTCSWCVFRATILNVEAPFFVRKVEGFRTKLPVTYKENSFPNVNFKLDKASLSANRKDFHRRRD